MNGQAGRNKYRRKGRARHRRNGSGRLVNGENGNMIVSAKAVICPVAGYAQQKLACGLPLELGNADGERTSRYRGKSAG